MDSSYCKRPPWRRARWMITASLITAVVLTSAIVLATGGGGIGKPQAVPTQPPGCPATAAGDALPAAPPGDVQWKSVGSIMVPTSATDGPARYDGAVWECYAHNPTGAVLAAYDIFAGLASPDWHVIAEHDVIPGQGQQAYIAASQSQTYSEPAPGGIAQAVGFEILAYTAQQATVETLADAGDDQYQASELTVAWYDGDWKMVLTPDGESGPDPQLVTSTDGFVLWGRADG
jgi:hypothetical protein